MPTIEKLSVALPSEMAALVRRAVDGGEYSSNSEVIRDALRDWTYKRSLREQGLTHLRKAWRKRSPMNPWILIRSRSSTAWKANWPAWPRLRDDNAPPLIPLRTG